MADDVQLTDLEVISRFSLAVRGATASRADVVAALEADLAWLTGSARPARAAASAPARATRTAAKATTAPTKTAAKTTPAKTPAKTTRTRKA